MEPARVAATRDGATHTEHVSVRVRVRPGGGGGVVALDDRVAAIGDKRFAFDRVHNTTATQEEIYAEAVAPLVAGVLDGYNAAVLAYGQTGSGKTYTMGCGGGAVAGRRWASCRAVADLFAAADRSGGALRVRATYVEIYNEELVDLLAPATPSAKLRDPSELGSRGVVVQGARRRARDGGRGPRAPRRGQREPHDEGDGAERDVEPEPRDPHARVEAAQGAPRRARRVASGRPLASTRLAVVRSKLHLCDLAGSERAKRSGAEGARLREGIAINCGLLTLGKVISALSDATGAGGPGTARTVMLACVSPDGDDAAESANTLGYAARARNIKNDVVANATVVVGGPDDAPALDAMKRENASLRAELEHAGGARSGAKNDALKAELARAAAPRPPPPPGAEDPEAAACAAALCDGHGAGALEQRDRDLAAVRETLADARGDLARDEEIFSAKAREAREAAKRADAAEARAARLEDDLRASEAARTLADALLKEAVAKRKSPMKKKRRGDDSDDDDDAASLDARLRASAAQATSKLARDLAEAEREKSERERSARKLQALENDIALKESCIAALAASEEEAKRAVRQYEDRVATLERDCSVLRSQLDPSQRARDAEELGALKRQQTLELGKVEALRRASEARLAELGDEARALRDERDAVSRGLDKENREDVEARDKLEKRAARWLQRKLDGVLTRADEERRKLAEDGATREGPAAAKAALDQLRRDLADLTPKHTSAALFESCRQLIAVKLARDAAEREAAELRGRLAAPTTVTPPKPVGPVLDARTVEEYESKIEFLLRELKQHESTPR
ncbi:microtubule motor protein [Aureococcus anophagefferens]|uniref:Kinesin-like protein n=1 Tax=Aureococcus anophagefferens TaxID=44056 RepID=A0ABR1FHF7_AURAN